MSGRLYAPNGHRHDEEVTLLDSVSTQPSAASSAHNLLSHKRHSDDDEEHQQRDDDDDDDLERRTHVYPPNGNSAQAALRAVQERDEQQLDGMLQRARTSRDGGRTISFGRGELVFIVCAMLAIAALAICAGVFTIRKVDW